MSFTYGGINTDDLEGVEVTPITYPNMGGLQLDIVETPGRDGRFYGGSRMTTSQLPFRVTISGETQQQADLRRLAFMRMLDPSTGARSLRLDNTANWHYPQAVVAQQIEWEKHADRSKVIYDGEVVFETNFDAAMRQIDPSTVSGVGQIEFVADMGSTVTYPTVIFESGGDIRVRVNEFIVDLYDTPPDTYGILNWDEYKFYTADADAAQSVLYEWEGSHHASPSVKKVGGEVVARNLAPDPRFEGDFSWWGSFGGSELLVIDRGNVFAGLSSSAKIATADIGAAGNNADLWGGGWDSITVAPGQWVAVRSVMAATQGSRVRQLVHWNTTGSTQYSSNYRPSVTDGEMQMDVFQAPAGSLSFSLRFQANRRDAVGALRVVLGDVVIAVADTEQEALAQVEHYFDGDNVGHIVPGERNSSLVNSMSHFERPAIYPGDHVEVEVTPIGSSTATPVIVYPNHRRL